MKNHKDHRGSSGEERQRWHEWGVSEVIGVVLLLALVVVGGTVVGTQLLSQPTPKEIPSVNFLANYEPGTLTLYHTGGDTLPKGDYKFVVQYEDGRTENFTRNDWSSGSSLTYPALSQPGKVTLIYTGNGAGETALRSVVIGDMGSNNSDQPVNPPAGNGTQTFTVSATAGTGGSITPSGTMTVNAGDSKSFTITADQFYHIVDLVDNGQSKGVGSTYSLTNILEDHTITVSFALDIVSDHTITASAGLNGKVNPSGAVSVPDGGSQTFTFTPDTGYHLTSITVDGQPASLDPYTFTNVKEDHTITGAFAIDTFTITVTQQGNGTVTPNGTVTVDYNSTPTFNFTPDTGYHLANVTVDGTPVTTSATSTGATYTFPPVTRGHNLNVTFALDAFTITVIEPQHGTISPYGTVDVVYGDTPNFTFTPAAGYRLAGVTVDDKPVTTSGNTYAFPPVNTNHTLAATFEAITCTINVTASLGGNITAVTSKGTVIIPPGTANQQITVAYGEQPTFTFTPDEGSHIADVVINGFSKGSVASYPFPLPVVDNSNTVAATFSPNVYAVNVTSGLNGSVTANDLTVNAGTTGTVNVGYNGQVNFTYLPVTGYHVGIVSYTTENGNLKELLIEKNASVLQAIQSNTTVVANFAIDTFAITVAPPVNGSITPSGTQTVDYNSTPTFTFSPEKGYHLGTVTVDGTPVTPAGNTYTFPPVTAAHTLEATFAIDTFTINATVGDHGAINPSGTITVNYDDSKDFIITADTGYHITSVTVDSTPLTVPAGNTSYPYTFSIITSDHTINASFAINTYTINATAGEHGTITPNGTFTVDYGSSKTFTITPETGYKIADVIVDGVSQGAITTYALTSIQSDHTISATFTQITYSINAYTDVKLGSINPSGSLTYTYHDTPSFTITPVTGYHITNLLVDGVSLGPDATYTFAALEDNHTITANFAIDTFTITATAGEGGTISPIGIVPANYGDSKKFTITPNSGSEIDTIYVDGIAVGETDSFTFTQINGNHTINVLFDVGGNGPYSIEGTFWNDLNGDGVNQSTEPPLEGWTVKVDIYHGQNSPLTRTLVTDKNGYYKFDNLPKGHYYVSEVAKSGWDQTYPWQHGGRDIDNLNPGRSDKHQHVTGVDFLNHLINGTFIPGTDFHLQASRPGYIEQGGFISFNITNTWSWVDMKSSGGTTTRYPLNVGDKAKIVIKSNSSGKIDAQFPQITTFEFPNADLFINDNLITTGAVPAIYVSMYDTYISTLTLKVPAPDQQLFSTFQVNGKDVFPASWPTNFNHWEYVIYNLKPSSSGQFHLNTQPPNAERETGLGEYYGGGDGYQMY